MICQTLKQEFLFFLLLFSSGLAPRPLRQRMRSAIHDAKVQEVFSDLDLSESTSLYLQSTRGDGADTKAVRADLQGLLGGSDLNNSVRRLVELGIPADSVRSLIEGTLQQQLQSAMQFRQEAMEGVS